MIFLKKILKNKSSKNFWSCRDDEIVRNIDYLKNLLKTFHLLLFFYWVLFNLFLIFVGVFWSILCFCPVSFFQACGLWRSFFKTFSRYQPWTFQFFNRRNNVTSWPASWAPIRNRRIHQRRWIRKWQAEDAQKQQRNALLRNNRNYRSYLSSLILRAYEYGAVLHEGTGKQDTRPAGEQQLLLNEHRAIAISLPRQIPPGVTFKRCAKTPTLPPRPQKDLYAENIPVYWFTQNAG